MVIHALALRLGALAIGGLLFAPTAPLADPAPVVNTTPASETFTTAQHAAGTVFTWVVPTGVTALGLTATGGNGGASSATRPGGLGAGVTVTLAVEPGQILSITLGGDGAGDGTGGLGYAAGGTGNKAGGGGSTAVLVNGDVTVIAGGGGGSSTASSAGGGGAGGTPAGLAGARRGGAGGSGGAGGLGLAPWGWPGGAGYLGSGGGAKGKEAAAGGGAGYGGGGAGGSGGDGGGGGSFSATPDTTAFSSRIDDGSIGAGGSVQLDYRVPVAPTPTATPAPTAPPATSVDVLTLIGMAAAAFVVLFIATLVIVRTVQRRRGPRRGRRSK